MTPEELFAREGIRDLVARYNSLGDSGRFEQLWDLFLAESVMEIRNHDGSIIRYDGLSAIQALFTGTKDKVVAQPAAPSERPSYMRHYVTTHVIDVADPQHASGRAYYAVLTPAGLDHWGRYVDRYVFDRDRWRFEHRMVTVDGVADDSRFGHG